MKFNLLLIAMALLLTSCDRAQDNSFQVVQPADNDLAARTKTYVLRLKNACPGLDRYSKDLTPATVDASAMEGYEGGIELKFQVLQNPQVLPSPLNVRSAKNSCFVSINKEGSRAYIAKSACHSICDGSWQDNSVGLLGREFTL
jgi:hypothetical protein